MAQINKPDEYFNTVLYTGDGTTPRNITGVGFNPDWVWIKNRSIDASHFLGDRLRGDNKNLNSNSSASEEDNSAKFRSLITDGFQVGNHAGANGSGNNIVAWNWLAGGTGVSNTDGSITSTVSANTTNGFSIVSYTGTGANATVGHGLGSVPKVMFVKRRSTSSDWTCYFESLGNTKRAVLNSTAVPDTASTFWNSTTPTSSVFSIGTSGGTNDSSETYIAYCFAEKKGFSKFGSYEGNNSSDGSFIYTGFSPSWVMIKNIDTSATAWVIQDSKRSSSGGGNQADKRLRANASNEEETDSAVDLLSNGFKIRSTGSFTSDANTYIYMCFAESPLVGTNNTPATAR